jgi:hypothetical protein
MIFELQVGGFSFAWRAYAGYEVFVGLCTPLNL